jgi:hypothetical protein
MRAFKVVLKVVAVMFVVVAALHLFFGLQADAMVGASVSLQTAADASLDSQNRFYGVNFSFLGVALYICASDLRRYEPILKSLLGVFFLSGVARVVSWAVRGAPAAGHCAGCGRPAHAASAVPLVQAQLTPVS